MCPLTSPLPGELMHTDSGSHCLGVPWLSALPHTPVDSAQFFFRRRRLLTVSRVCLFKVHTAQIHFLGYHHKIPSKTSLPPAGGPKLSNFPRCDSCSESAWRDPHPAAGPIPRGTQDSGSPAPAWFKACRPGLSLLGPGWLRR